MVSMSLVLCALFVAVAYFANDSTSAGAGVMGSASISLRERIEAIKTVITGCPPLIVPNGLINCTKTVKKVVQVLDCTKRVPVGSKAYIKCMPDFSPKEKYKFVTCSSPRKWNKPAITCTQAAPTTTPVTEATTVSITESTAVTGDNTTAGTDINGQTTTFVSDANAELTSDTSSSPVTNDPLAAGATTLPNSVASSLTSGAATIVSTGPTVSTISSGNSPTAATTAASSNSVIGISASSTVPGADATTVTGADATTVTGAAATTAAGAAVTTTVAGETVTTTIAGTAATTVAVAAVTTTVAGAAATTVAGTSATTAAGAAASTVAAGAAASTVAGAITTTVAATTTLAATTAATTTMAGVTTALTTTAIIVYAVDAEPYQTVETFGMYKAYNLAKTWDLAQNKCVSDGAQLFIPDTYEEYIAVSLFARKQLLGEHIWIGFTDKVTEGTFLSTRGGPFDRLKFNATWYLANPDNINNQDCLLFYMLTRLLDDLHCNYQSFNYVCEK